MKRTFSTGLLFFVLSLLSNVTPGLAAATLVVTSDTLIDAGSLSHDGDALVIESGTLTIKGPHRFDNVTVTGTGRWRVADPEVIEVASLEIRETGVAQFAGGSRLVVRDAIRLADQGTVECEGRNIDSAINGEWLGQGVKVEAVTLSVASGAWITANTRGYVGATDRGHAGAGPGGGGNAGDYGRAGGAGHGGWGQSVPGIPLGRGGPSYGSPFMPKDLGSGGGGGNADWARGGQGGGAIHLAIAGVVELNGLVSANGGDGSRNFGGASGGSVLIEAQTLRGSGAVEAKGGSGGPEGGASGAGGRVAIYFQKSEFTGHDHCSVDGGPGAEDGTLGFLDRTIPALGVALHQRFVLPRGALAFLGRIEVKSGGRLELETDTKLVVADRVEIESGGSAILGGASLLQVTNGLDLVGSNVVVETRTRDFTTTINNEWAGIGVTIRAGAMTVSEGSRISADEQGYLGATGRGHDGGGPGGGGHAGDYGRAGGAGHGGRGQSVPGIPLGRGGAPYGSAFWPEALGSGGGGGNADGGQGGRGGGAIHLVVDGTLELNGTFSANGGAGVQNFGGASGGSILIEAGQLKGAGKVEAKGGLGGPDGAASGCGGRIAVYYRTNQFTGHSGCSVAGGAGAEDGTLGFFDRSVPALGLVLHQRFVCAEGEEAFLGRVQVNFGGRLELGTEAKLVVADGVEIGSGGSAILGGASWLQVTNGLRLVGSNVVMETRTRDFTTTINNEWAGIGVTIRAGAMTVSEGARITADEQGYLGATGRGHDGGGPGGGGHAGDYGRAGGAGHGGWGQSVPGIPLGRGGAPYDSAFWPEELGSGGGGGNADWGQGGRGGGAIHLVVDGTIELNGTLSANGGAGVRNFGGASGGSILIETDHLKGAGIVEAKGGMGGPEGAANGAGGRIAVYYRTSEFSGQARCSVAGGAGAEDGTLGFFDRSVPALGMTLFQRFALVEGGFTELGRVQVQPGGRLELGTQSEMAVRERLEILEGGSAMLGGGSTLRVTNELRLRGTNAVIEARAKDYTAAISNQWVGTGVFIRAGDLVMDEGSRITADEQGYVGATDRGHAGLGPGGGGHAGDYGRAGGAGHGGWGQSVPGIPLGQGGAPYGSGFWPEALGSGGGGGNADWGQGGRGGGAIHLVVDRAMELNGTVSANGGAGVRNFGGASGGSILIEADTFLGRGSLESKGGLGGPEGAANGAGGRIAVYYRTSKFDGHARCSVAGGTGADDGTLGFFDRSVPALGLELHHRFALRDHADVELGQIRIVDGGRLELGLDGVLNVQRDMDLDSGGQAALGGRTRLVVTQALRLLGSNAVIHARSADRSTLVDGAWVGRGVFIQAGSAEIGQGASIEADAQGYVGASARAGSGRGPGGGGPGYDWGRGGGGGYGGVGQRVSGIPAGWGGGTYGADWWPVALGSGGGSGNADNSKGGDGGGAIHLVIGGSMKMDGLVSANGGAGTGNCGGGSGGSVLVQCGILSGNGRIEARGGSGGENAAGGGGGRVALFTWERHLFPPSHCDLSPGGGGVEGGNGSLHIAGPEFGLRWTGLESGVVHGLNSVGWFAPAVNPIGARGTLALEAPNQKGLLADGVGPQGELIWDTGRWPDGRHVLHLEVRGPDGTLLVDETHGVTLLNAAVWHTGVMAASETWSPDRAHWVGGELRVASGVTLTIEPGTLVKSMTGATWIVEDGGAVEARGAGGMDVVLTSAADDVFGGDGNADGFLSVGRAGDWSYATRGSGRWLSNASTLVRFARVRYSGELSGETIFAGALLHEIPDKVVIPSGARLVIDPGAVVKFDNKATLVIAEGGVLEARGTASDPIVITSAKDDTAGGDSNRDGASSMPAAGDWLGIQVAGDATLEGTLLRFGGGSVSGSWERSAMVRCDVTGRVSLRRCQIIAPFFDGILAYGATTLEDCLITDADRAVAVHGGSVVTLTHGTLVNSRQGVQIHGGTASLFNTLIVGSTENGIIRDLPSPDPIVRSCNLWNPTASQGETHGIPAPFGVSGNRRLDPDFVDAARGDYRLNYLSPCIDAAAGDSSTDRDLADAPRYDDPRTTNTGTPTGSGAYADIGAFEFVENAASEVDLVVVSVAGPSEVEAGEQVTVRWRVENLGVGAAVGGWHDRILLEPTSSDVSSSPIEVATVASAETLGSGQGLELQATLRVPGGTEGSWRWVVRANAQGEIFEGRNSVNNLGQAATPTQLRIPSLSLTAPVAGSWPGPQGPAWFKLVSGTTRPLEVRVAAADREGRVRIYAAARRMPSVSEFDARSEGDGVGGASCLVPGVDDGVPVYLLIVPEELSGGSLGFSIEAKVAALHLLETGVARAGNTGKITLPLRGQGFRPGVSAWLLTASGRRIDAAQVATVSASTAYAQFQLTNAPLGICSVVVASETEQSELRDALELVATAGAEIEVRLVLPEFTREQRPFDLFLEYTNPGDIDLAIPRLGIACLDGTGEIWLPGADESKYRESALSLVRLTAIGSGDGATNVSEVREEWGLMETSARTSTSTETTNREVASSPLILPPGTTRRVQFRSASTASVPRILYEARVGDADEDGTMDYERLHRAIVPPLPHPLWTNAWAKVVADAGPTRGGYQRALLGAAGRARAFGLDLLTEQELLTFLVQEAIEAVQDAPVKGRLYLGNINRPLGREVVVLRPIPKTADAPWYLTTSWYDGSFGVRHIPPGEYALEVQGYQPAQATRVLLSTTPVVGLQVILTQRSARVDGTVTEGPQRAPLPDLGLVARNTGSGEVHLGETDSTGNFSIQSLEPGTYALQTLHGERLAGDAASFTVAEGQAVSLSLANDSAIAELRGVVRNAAGQSVSGAEVSIVETESEDYRTTGRTRVVQTDERGAFVATSLVPGVYRISAAKSGAGASSETRVPILTAQLSAVVDLTLETAGTLAGRVLHADSRLPMSGARVFVDLPGWRGLTALSGVDGGFQLGQAPTSAFTVVATALGFDEGATPVTSAGGNRTGVTVALEPHGSVIGRVTLKGRAGAGLKVLLTRPEGPFLEATTGDDGDYRFSNLPGGNYSIALGEWSGPWMWGADLRLESGTREVRRDFQLDQSGTISGRCLAADGVTPMRGVVVSLSSSNQVIAQVMTEADGRFGFLVLEPGTFDVLATSSQAVFQVHRAVEVIPRASVGALDFVAPSGTVTIQVSEDSGGGNVVGAEVQMEALPEVEGLIAALSGLTDGVGACRWTGLAPGGYRLRVKAPGFAPTEARTFVSSDLTTVLVSLERCGRIGGTVTGNGAALREAVVLVSDTSGVVVASTLTASDGRYELDTLPRTAFELWVVAGERWQASRVALNAIPAGESRLQNVDLAEAGPALLSGRVLTSDGRPSPLAVVELRHGSGVPMAIDIAGMQRGFALAGWPSGRWSLGATAAGHRSAEIVVDVVEGQGQGRLDLMLSGPVAMAWTGADAAASGGNSRFAPQAIARMSPLEAFGGWVADGFTGEVWPEFVQGDYGMQCPQLFIDQQTLDLEAHLGLYEQAIDQAKTSCSGVVAGWAQCKQASSLAFQAERDWNDAYRAMRAMNTANAGTVTTRALVVALKTWKLALGISKFNQWTPEWPSSVTPGMYDLYGTVLNADSLRKSDLVRQRKFLDAGGWLSGAGIAVTLAQQRYTGGVAANRLKILGFLREGLGIAKDVYEGYYEMQTLDQNVGNGLLAYLSGQDNYVRALQRYKDGLKLMQAGLADCRKGGGTHAGPPPMDDLKLVADGFVKVVGSKDPNDKLSTGVGSASFIRPREPILYTIRFENVKTASAPAQTVTILDPLDPNLDWSTFQPIEIAFNHVRLAVPPAAQDYTTTTRVATDPYPVVARVKLDRRQGMVHWRMESLDEVTGGIPEDPLAGFLPPNDADHRGEGHVTFSILPRSAGLTSGTFTNRATIVFDVNAPILTPTVTNHLDAVPPESVAWFAGSLAGRVRIASSANDGMGSGIAGTELWVSRDQGAFERWDETEGPSAAWIDPSPGSVLRIFSVATDHAGNRERPPQEPDATLEFLTAVTIVSVHPLTLQWPGAMGTEYGVERSMDGDRWSTVAGPISVVGGRAAWTDGAPPAGSAFYRVRKW
ncbi:MAG: carboxypeptidase regulatory-like domain-containing protein [Verrucomicrobiales bacterium]|nr:carboxypeptidase regulatory-like domain-containing protein [Verrucomicrobiales bacterium]